jgi:hypothetical protein
LALGSVADWSCRISSASRKAAQEDGSVRGQGIEAFSVASQDVVPRAVQDLVAECDALIPHAEYFLGDLPQEPVRYYPEQRSSQSPK